MRVTTVVPRMAHAPRPLHVPGRRTSCEHYLEAHSDSFGQSALRERSLDQGHSGAAQNSTFRTNLVAFLFNP